MRGETCSAVRRWPEVALMVLVVLVGALVSGCLRGEASMTVSSDDRVSGQLRIGIVPAPNRPPLRFRAPEELADRVDISPYRSDGYVGSEVTFENLTFPEVERLGAALNPASSRYRLTIDRSGSLVVVDGTVDLTPLANTDSSLRVELTVPGEVTNTNGRTTGDVIVWEPEAGEVTRMRATVQFGGEAAVQWIGWTVGVTTASLGVAVVVGMLALWTHRSSRRSERSRAPTPR